MPVTFCQKSIFANVASGDPMNLSLGKDKNDGVDFGYIFA